MIHCNLTIPLRPGRGGGVASNDLPWILDGNIDGNKIIRSMDTILATWSTWGKMAALGCLWVQVDLLCSQQLMGSQ